MRTSFLLALAVLTAGCAGSGPPRPDHRPFGGRDHGPPPDAQPRYLFISPMGEPFRTEHPERAWFAGVDADHDGRITPAEFRADADRFFRVLDRQKDGEIDPGDVEFYENELAPEIRVGGTGPGGGGGGGRSGGDRGGGGRSGGGGGRGPGGGAPGGSFSGPGGGGMGGSIGGRGGRRSDGEQSAGAAVQQRASREGAARYGYLDLPEPVTAADTNLNRGVDLAEFERAADERFILLDRNQDGVLTTADLPALDTRMRGGRGRPAGGRPPDRGPPSQMGNRERDPDD